MNILSRRASGIGEAKDTTNDSMKMSYTMLFDYKQRPISSEKKNTTPHNLTLLPIADATISINTRKPSNPRKDRKNIHPNKVNSSLMATMRLENIDEKYSYPAILETGYPESRYSPTSETELPETPKLATQSSKPKIGRFVPYCQQEMNHEHLVGSEKKEEETISFLDRIGLKWGATTKGKAWTGREIESRQKGSLRTKVYKFPLPMII